MNNCISLLKIKAKTFEVVMAVIPVALHLFVMFINYLNYATQDFWIEKVTGYEFSVCGALMQW